MGEYHLFTFCLTSVDTQFELFLEVGPLLYFEVSSHHSTYYLRRLYRKELFFDKSFNFVNARLQNFNSPTSRSHLVNK